MDTDLVKIQSGLFGMEGTQMNQSLHSFSLKEKAKTWPATPSMLLMPTETGISISICARF